MSTLNGKNILVTGGTGFVGSHLVEDLDNLGVHVITTYQSLNPYSYFIQQQLSKRVTVAPVDIVDFERLFDLVTKSEIDYIFHLAAQPLVETAYYNPRRTLDTNIRGTINILESARLYPRIKGIIVASSDKAYGKLEGKDKYKESDPLRGDHPYEVSKSAADLITTSYYKTYDVPVVTTRFGNIYGEGDLNFSRIIPGIMKSLITNQTLQLRSDGSHVRDYLYVKDVVDGYILLAQHIDEIKGEAFNFGSHETYSVLALIQEVEKALKQKIQYIVLNESKNEIPYQSLNFTKIKKRLSWEPKRTLKTITQTVFDWYTEQKDCM
ncbi:GDP-mannose 4,6-dehydratase [Candidatus Woesebacteria bacterium]|nr:GDP-mannose 4,6-dehydratase [Candidatus Woesebacteria bacterium]